MVPKGGVMGWAKRKEKDRGKRTLAMRGDRSSQLKSQRRHLQAARWGPLMENRGSQSSVWPKGLSLSFFLDMHVLSLS